MNWRNIIVYGTTMAMELCWLYVVLALINKHAANEQLFIAGILLFHPLAFGLNKLLQRLAWHKTITTTVNWLAWVIVMLITVKIQLFSDLAWLNPDWILSLPRAIPQLVYTFKPELLLLISSAVIWWLGKWLAQRSANFATAMVEFQFGLFILIITFVITSALDITFAESIPIALAFFCIALFGISIAHAQEGRSWLHEKNKLQWSWLLLLSIVLILILGLIFSAVISHDILQLIVDAIKWFFRLVMKAIIFIISLLPKPEQTGTLPPGMELPPMEPEENGFSLSIPEPIRSWLQILLAFIWIGLIVVALWQVSSQIYKWLSRRLPSKGAETEPLKGAFAADLMGLLKRIVRYVSRINPLFWLQRKTRSSSPEAVSVRQIYHRLLQWGAARGYPRQLWQTPNEYLNKLAGLIPQLQGDLSFITQHYVITRYGNSIPTASELDQLKQSWKKVKESRLRISANSITENRR